jgi:acyl carrier protein
MSAEMESKIIDVITNKLGVKKEECQPEKNFVDDLGADSLAQVELVMALEDEFGLEIPDEDSEKLKTVGAVLDYVKSKV